MHYKTLIVRNFVIIGPKNMLETQKFLSKTVIKMFTITNLPLLTVEYGLFGRL